MSLQQRSLRKTYFHYLFAGLGSAVVISIYSLVDAIMVGQYEGSDGSAALSVVMPIWTIILSLGLLFGVGGGVLMSKARGEGDRQRGDVLFTRAFFCVAVVTVTVWALLVFFETPLLRLFGANDTLLPLAKGYLKWLKFAVPLFTLGQFFVCFIRNDNAPAKAMAAVIAGGIFNIGGDYFFVFVRDMGIEGAELATALGEVLCVAILATHFFSKKNGLRLTKPNGDFPFFKDAGNILWAGFSVFVVDLAMGILTMLFNNQIMKYLGSSALAVYGVLANIFMLAQSISYGVGQAAQPIISVCYGAGKANDIRRVHKYGVFSAFAVALVVFAAVELFPLPIVRTFMRTTPEIEKIAPHILRVYALSFLLMPRNVFFTYYFQSVMRPMASLAVSLVRGIFVSSILIFALPALFGGDLLWWVMPVTEIVTYAVGLLLSRNTRLPESVKGAESCGEELSCAEAGATSAKSIRAAKK